MPGWNPGPLQDQSSSLKSPPAVLLTTEANPGRRASARSGTVLPIRCTIGVRARPGVRPPDGEHPVGGQSTEHNEAIPRAPEPAWPSEVVDRKSNGHQGDPDIKEETTPGFVRPPHAGESRAVTLMRQRDRPMLGRSLVRRRVGRGPATIREVSARCSPRGAAAGGTPPNRRYGTVRPALVRC